ncbi:uncharacterized protein [Trachinotus anak]|uniref:uncharacterized protein n=1 Tax=Trachinotus anak TaxID=443729 RepID=UPI0039F25598
MPRFYKQKTDRASTPLMELDRAVGEVQNGKSICQVARDMKIDRMTLKRYMDMKELGEVKSTGYKRTGHANQVFNEEIETELADHIKNLAAMFHGLSAMKCRELAFELAQRNDIDVPASWMRGEKAGLSKHAFIKIGNINNYFSGKCPPSCCGWHIEKRPQNDYV